MYSIIKIWQRKKFNLMCESKVFGIEFYQKKYDNFFTVGKDIACGFSMSKTSDVH